MKDFFKKNAGLIIMVVAIIVVWYFFLRKKKAPESSFRLGLGLPRAIRGGTSPVNVISCRRCWVTTKDCSVTPCKETCNWYDDNGAITRTFNSACSERQSTMAGSTTAHNVTKD